MAERFLLIGFFCLTHLLALSYTDQCCSTGIARVHGSADLHHSVPACGHEGLPEEHLESWRRLPLPLLHGLRHRQPQVHDR